MLKVSLPETKLADIDLDVTKKSIKAESAKFRLSTFLPCVVDPDRGDAAWDATKFVLTVTLPIVPEEW